MSEKNELDYELQKTIFREVENIRIVLMWFDSILDADLAYMKLLSSLSKGFRYSLYAIDVFSKHPYALHLTSEIKYELIIKMMQ